MLADFPPTTGELASLGDRFVGSLIDGLINIAFVVLMVFGSIRAGLIGSFMEFVDLGLLPMLAFSLAGFAFHIAINWKFLSASGQTIGKKAVRTRIVKMDGTLPSMVDLVGKREAFYYLIVEIPVVGMFISLLNILFIFGRERRCLHDMVAGTRVIKAVTGTF
jgi:uncharacterized RDD family membrane protein YckC